MSLQNMIYRLRSEAKLSQSEFAALFDVSAQAVQKWETGASTPALDKVVAIAKRFGISMDALVLERDARASDELPYNKKYHPKYANMHEWELYCEGLETEYRQSVEEGLDISSYKALFDAVSKMPRGENKKRMADVIFDIVRNAPMTVGYAYNEPSTLEGIRALRKSYDLPKPSFESDELFKKIYGAWMGRVCGCLLGKPFEGMRTDRLIPFLKQTENYPMCTPPTLISSGTTDVIGRSDRIGRQILSTECR